MGGMSKTAKRAIAARHTGQAIGFIADDLISDCRAYLAGPDVTDAGMAFAQAVLARADCLSRTSRLLVEGVIGPGDAALLKVKTAAKENASHPRATVKLGSTLRDAINKVAADAWPNTSPTAPGWKGRIAHELQIETKSLRRHVEGNKLTYEKVKKILTDWRPPPPPANT